jgi:hypothetical protein
VTSKSVIKKYRKMLEAETGVPLKRYAPPPTAEYKQFKDRFLPRGYGIYEKICTYASKAIQISPSPKKKIELDENLRASHQNLTAEQAFSAQFVVPISILLVGFFVSIVFLDSLFYAFFSILAAAAIAFLMAKLPKLLAANWRLRASNQMVLCIFYIVTYMKHTSNLEKALQFAAQYLSGPLATDLSKVLEDSLTKFSSVDGALGRYLETWTKYNPEFVNSFSLIQRSLLEGNEKRRRATLDRALTEILQATEEKMLHYAQDLKSKIMTLHMLGVVLPILGLVILPLMVSFMEGVAWYHIATLYNFILPGVVLIMGKIILSERPTGYGDTDLSEAGVQQKKTIPIIIGGKKLFELSPRVTGILVASTLTVIALLPLIIHFIVPGWDLELPLGFKLLGFRESITSIGVEVGPFGIGASILSLFFPIAFAYGVGLYYSMSVKDVHKIRERTKKIEAEFSTSLYQLGNVLAQGQPPEKAFVEASKLMRASASGQFFRQVSLNISRGMNFETAMFDKRRGAMVQFPSNIINSSMRIMSEAAKKSSTVAAETLWGISIYIKDIHKVNERLKDLLADVLSDMRSQIAMLTPAIAGIVIGITSMITFILGSLAENFRSVSGLAGGGTVGNLTTLFGDGLPTYYFQLVVGIYVCQIVYVLTILQNGIENGADSVSEKYQLGKNLMRSPIIYCTITLIVMIIFNLIAAVILSRTTGMGV